MRVGYELATEKRKFLVGVPGQCGARKGGSGGGGSGAGRVGCSWSGAGRGGAGKGGGSGGGGLGGMRVGSELPKTEKRQFLVGFLDRVE